MIHGWLNIYKPSGVTSFDVIRKLKRVLCKNIKIGHGGTLDPLAEGILPIALGHATKFIHFVQDNMKIYECTILWGTQTDTDDITGQITHTSQVRPTPTAIENILPEFMGEILQTPPIYSALKVAGKPAYTYARKGQEIALTPRFITIHHIETLNFDRDTAVLRVTCAKGTYIRAIARDMGLKLGTYGTIQTLKRTQVGPFTQENAINIFDFGENQAIMDRILRADYVLDDILAYPLDTTQWQHIAHGRPIVCSLQGMVALRYNGNVVALGQGDGSVVHPHKVVGVYDVATQSSTH